MWNTKPGIRKPGFQLLSLMSHCVTRGKPFNPTFSLSLSVKWGNYKLLPSVPLGGPGNSKLESCKALLKERANKSSDTIETYYLEAMNIYMKTLL